MPEFDDRVTIKQPFHICEHELGYDMIIGRETLAELGFIIDFKSNQISWNDMKVEMKHPTFFDNKENLALFAFQAEPEKCQQALKRAVHIMDMGRNSPPNINNIVNGYKHLESDHKTKLKHLLNDYEALFDGTLGDWKTPPISVELKEGAKSHHSKPYPVPHIHRA